MAKNKIMQPLLIGLVGGALALGGNAVYQTVTGNSPLTMSSSSGSTTVSNVSYNVQTSSTTAIKKVSNAVVSVLNYQSQSTNSNSNSDLWGNLFGNGGSSSNSDSSQPVLTSEGSGVIYKKSGNTAYIVTNNHVTAGASELQVLLSSGQTVTATLVGADSYTDLAVLKIDAKYVTTVAAFGDSSRLNVGEPAIAVGSPLGSDFANTATEGIISALSRQVTMQNDQNQTINVNVLQTDAAINPGNSGGALINIEGQVIGITSSKITVTQDSSGTPVEGMGFAIPSNDVVMVINQLEKNGKMTPPLLGITGQDLSSLSSSQTSALNLPSSVTSGAVIASVNSGDPAATAGLKANDVITAIDNRPVTSMLDLQGILYLYSVNDTATITYYRDGKKETVSVKLNMENTSLANQVQNGTSSSN